MIDSDCLLNFCTYLQHMLFRMNLSTLVLGELWISAACRVYKGHHGSNLSVYLTRVVSAFSFEYFLMPTSDAPCT